MEPRKLQLLPVLQRFYGRQKLPPQRCKSWASAPPPRTNEEFSRAQELGFSTRSDCFRLTRRRSACAEVKSITQQHIADIRRRIDERKRLEQALGALVGQCRAEISDCPILDALGAPAKRARRLRVRARISQTPLARERIAETSGWISPGSS